MPFRRLPLPEHAAGSLWLDAMPGRLAGWPAFVAEAERHGLTDIVCLNPLHEVASGSPAYHQAIVKKTLPWRWHPLAMHNFGLADEAVFRSSIEQLADGLLAGQVVLLHCSAGLGRTGTAAACVLKRLGVPTEQALRQVLAAGSNPQSALQSGLIDRF
jgi:Tyrosine phosphatase family